ncbi:histidine phosphatase family protein [Catellatospora sp. NPDC049609]|uniref:histidine phosphatase family protein n=1 Tax=Catellatospora sp. NPDC049609 TaxID=3155505 RepID=UPI00341B0CAC
MRHLVVIRHALAHCNVAKTVGGPVGCSGLHPDGARQASRAAARLSTMFAEPPAAIRASPRRRAVETATPIAERFGLPLAIVDELREPDCGPHADGRPWAEILHEARDVDRDDPAVPLIAGGELWATHVKRVTAALQALLDERRDGTVLVVGHAETITAAFHLFLNIGPDERPSMKIEAGNASATIWSAASGSASPPSRAWSLAAHNLALSDA